MASLSTLQELLSLEFILIFQIPMEFLMKGSDSPNNETEEDPEEISSSLFGGRVANKKTKKK
tara:strand:- start:554 stop:739 length:186 start_codon:yes stop_codon:yes gene_type:complete